MTCPQKNHHLLLIYCLFVLLHVQQTVNSLQNGYHRHPAEVHNRFAHNPLPHRSARKGAGVIGVDDLGRRELVVNGVREREREHHFRHQHNRQLHRHQQHGSSIGTMRNDEVHPQSGPPPLSNVQRFGGRRIEEAVHAFRISTTERPAPIAWDEHSVHHHPPHHKKHEHNNQPLQRQNVFQHSARQHPHHTMHQQTPRPKPDVSQESFKKSLEGPAHHDSRSGSRTYDFTTASPFVLRTVPAMSRTGSFKGPVEEGTLHAVHSDASDDDYDDDEYYYYEGDNDNDDDDDNNDGNDNHEEHANRDASGWSSAGERYTEVIRNGLSDEETVKDGAERVLASSEDVLRDNEMDYDEHNFLADEPIDGLGSLSEQKWRNYSTREGVEKMARAENPNIAAAAHLKRINHEGFCRYPHPRVIPISNNTSKRFVPHCTILHRCGDDTGCCWSDARTCVAKSTETVVLYFYVIPMGQTRSVIEPLSLINHTECHCVDRSQVRTTTTPSMFDTGTPMPERPSGRCVKYFDLDETDPDYIRCDCLDRNSERREACQRLSRGEEGFLLEDQRCISHGRCKPPACEYGQYNRTMGRCPSKDHKIEIAKNVNQPFH